MFEVVLGAAALLATVVVGLLFGFVVVAMPGLGTLPDRDFLRGFKAMDRIIQDGHPAFMAVWVGSVLAIVGATVLGIRELDGARLAVLVGSSTLYLLGLQLPTAVVNIPMNNAVQAMDLDTAPDQEVEAARRRFEARWNRWNTLRTTLGMIACIGLIVVLAW